MAERDRAAIEELVRRVLLEKLGGNGPRVKKVEVPRLDVAAEHRMDTGNPADGCGPGTCSLWRRPPGWAAG